MTVAGPVADQQAAAAPDVPTLVALAVLAGAASTVLHEAIGHGGACVLSGGHNLLITSVSETCNLANRWIDAAGTLVNLAAGGIFLAWSRHVHQPRFRFFLWLAFAFNWLAAAGYWLFSGIGGFGDWAAVLAGVQPQWLWRAGMAIAGGVIYLGILRLAVWELKPFLPRDKTRVGHARRLMLAPYFAYGFLSCVAGAFNPAGAILIADSAAAVSFGGASGLAWGWQWVAHPHFAQPGPELPPITRSRGWIFAAIVAAAVLIGVFGPGLGA